MRFVRFLKKHGISINEKTLEKYESEGWIQPAFRLVIPEQLQSGTLFLANDNIRKFHKDRLTELPKAGDYEPWSNFKADYKKGIQHDKKLMYYHSFQILQVRNILNYTTFQFTYFDSYGKHDLEKIMAGIAKLKKSNDARFNTSLFEQVEDIGLLMLLEEPYRPQVFGNMSLPARRNDDGYKSWLKWREKFSTQKFLDDNGFSVEQVRNLHDHFVIQARHLDPLIQWYDLIRIMKRTTIERLKGDALTAQLYYNIVRMIALFLYDHEKKKIKEPDLFFDGMDGEWKKDVYSNPFDYGTRKTQRGIIRRFVGDPTTRLYILVEGDTEEKVIEKIFERWNVSMTDDGISVINCKGVTNIKQNKLDKIIQSANQDYIAMYVIADNESNSEPKIKKIQECVKTEFNYHIWNKNFEEDNFRRRKVITLINSYLRAHGKSLSYNEIKVKQKSGMALVSSIEAAYTSKYHKNLYSVIGKSKPDISLKLMESRIKKIAPDSKVGEQTAIEKVLREALDMIPSWG